MIVLAIDPGNEYSGWVLYDTALKLPLEWAKEPNADVLTRVAETPAHGLAIEIVASYGMAVGQDVFNTCVWVGRYYERWLVERTAFVPVLVYRKQVKHHLCGSIKAKDANVRQAIIDIYGPGKEKAIGKKASPGPLYGMSGDCWSAMAVALTVTESEDFAAAMA